MEALDRKVALITGGASGIGRATAERFAKEGTRVCIVDVADEGREVAERLGGIFIGADVGDAEQNDAAFERCVSELGGLDIAFLNAGIALGVADLVDLDDADYRRIMRVNVDGVVFGARAAIRAMLDNGGAIVATSSLAGLMPFPMDPIYDATKHAIVGLIRSIAESLGTYGITANTVNPGFTDTNLFDDEAKTMLAQSGFPLMACEQIADTVLEIVTGGGTGKCWICQPGRDPIAYEFHGVPGPRGEGEGLVPPSVWDNE
jgi:NAD(P)-dependent dehydrogenase (short-subunit alcohol dehydrogenase family)